MSPNTRRLASIFGAALLLGVGGNLLFGASPAAVKPVAADELPWQPVGMRMPDLARADGIWEARAPWGAAPKPAEPPPVPPPPPPMPVGIVGTGNARQAIFLVPGAGELRLGTGGVLPDGGSVLEVSALKVSWVDGTGERHERQMFRDPVEFPAGSGTGTGAPMAVAAQAPGPGGRPGGIPGPGGPAFRPAAQPEQATSPPPSSSAAPTPAGPPSAPAGPGRRAARPPPGAVPGGRPGGS